MDAGAKRDDLMEEVRSHFNEPVLCGLEVGRIVGYGSDTCDCYLVVVFPGTRGAEPRTVWHTMVGGYVYLGCLRGQCHVVGYTGEDWDDLFRLDGDLTRAGVPKVAEFLVLSETRPLVEGLFAEDANGDEPSDA